jgi:hypothetical protein
MTVPDFKNLGHFGANRYFSPQTRPEGVVPGRVERPTKSLGNSCSVHLSYGTRQLSEPAKL